MNSSKISALLLIASLSAASSLHAASTAVMSTPEPIVQLAPVVVEAPREVTLATSVQASLDDLRAAAARPDSFQSALHKAGRHVRLIPVSGAGKRLHAPRVSRL